MRGATLIDFNAENRSARLSFASETPVRDYWYGKEILRVNDTAMGSERLKPELCRFCSTITKTRS